MNNTSLTDVIRQYILYKEWLHCIYSVEHLASGEYNSNYLVKAETGEYVFRINHGSQLFLDNQIEYEFNVLKTLENSGVTPRPFFYDSRPEAFECGVLLMEYLDGRPLNYSLDMEKAAYIFSVVHTQSFGNSLILQKSPIEDICSESIKLISMNETDEYSDTRNLLLEYHSKMIKLSDKNRNIFKNENMCVVNTEVNSGNFIISEKRGCLVDWEKAVISYRYQDLAHFIIPTTTLWKTDFRISPEKKIEFLNTYLRFSDIDVSADELIFKTEMLEKVILLRALSWCYMAYDQYINGNKDLTHENTFSKIKYYLDNAECFLKS